MRIQSILEDMASELSDEQKLYDYMKSRMELMPPGSLFVSKTGAGNHYYQRLRLDGRQRTIPLDPSVEMDADTIKKLVEKKTLVHAMPILRKNIASLESSIPILKPYHPALFEFGELLGPQYYLGDDVCIREWMNKKDQQNHLHPENQIFECKNGKMLRSKSEVFIADFLIDHAILFKNEPKLEVGGEVFFPDFELLHPFQKRLFWWEHLGLIEEPKYVFKNLHKLNVYSKHGIILGENLILTYETRERPLTRSTIIRELDYHGFLK